MYHGLVKHGVFLSVLISLIVIVGGQASSAQELPEDRLNIVIVMTDDPRASGLAEMPNVQALLVERRTTFENFTINLPPAACRTPRSCAASTPTTTASAS